MQKITKKDFARIINNPEITVTDECGTCAYLKNDNILCFVNNKTKYNLDNHLLLADGGRLIVVLDAGGGARCEMVLIVKVEVDDVMEYIW